MRRTRSRVVGGGVLVALVLSSVAALAVGGDPGLGQQWGLAQIKARAAWDRGVIGAGSAVAVIDTGADLGHEDLGGQIAAAITCVNTDGDLRRCTNGGEDIQGHGSHVAGIAGAASNTVGVSGVAPAARLVVVRVFQEDVNPLTGAPNGEFYALSSDVSAAIQWVVANVGAKGAINLSLGGDFVVTTVGGTGFEDAIEAAWRAGWVTVLASGNDNLFDVGGSSNYGSLNAVVVGATGPDGEMAAYSSPFGSAKWALVAPGGNAESCEDEPERCVLSTYRGGDYAFLQGTSMATPHVAGAVALLMGAGLSNSQAVERLLATADRSRSCGSGCDGRLDLAAATAGLSGGAPSGGGSDGGGGGAAPAPPPAASPTTTRPAGAAPSRPAAPPGSPVTAGVAAVPDGSVLPAEAPATSEPPASDAVTDLSVDEAAGLVDGRADDDGRDGPPPMLVIAALLGLVGASAATVLAARRRGQASAP